MNDTIINVRTTKEIKDTANKIFSEMGINTSIAINLFLKQSIMKHRLPFDVDTDITINNNIKNTYPKGYFDLFGSGKDIDIKEPKDIDLNLDGDIEL